jgi:ribonuclease Z
LRDQILIPKLPNKTVYVTDGATSTENRQALLGLIQDADLMYSETCFLPEDQKLADQTKHFTTEFIAKLAEEAGVKKLAPFHFSKRYQDRPDQVLASLSEHFHGEVISLKKDNSNYPASELSPHKAIFRQLAKA